MASEGQLARNHLQVALHSVFGRGIVVHRYLLLIAFIAFPVSAVSSAASADKVEISSLIDRFRDSIAGKDRQAFLDLFLNESVTWQSVMSGERYALARMADPHATRSAGQPGQSPRSFIDGIASSPAHIEETFKDVQVDTDGTVASVAFDFEFLRDKEVINAGREYWLLVKTDAGWKIALVVWSRNKLPNQAGRLRNHPNSSRN